MSYFNDELRDVMGSIKNGQSASGLDFFIELKRKINNGYELYSEFNLRLIFSDITLQNEFSSLLSTIKLERIILRSILKNKDKKITIDDLITNIFESNNQLDFHTYIRGGEFYSGTGSVVGRQVKVGKTVGVQRGAGPMAMEDDGDRKIRDLKKKYTKFYKKFGMGQKSINDNFSLINYIIYLIKFAVIIAISGFLGYYLASNKDDIYQYVSQKYEKLSSYKLEVFDNYFSQESNKNLNDKYRNSETSDEINYNYAGNDFPKKCDDEDVLNIIYKYAENSKKRLCLTVPYFMNLPMSQMFQKCGIGISSSNVNSNLNLKHIVKLEYNEKTDFVKCKGVMYADFGEYGMSGGREITYTIEKTTENLPYVSISPGRLFQ